MHMQVFRPQNLAELVATGACLTRVEGDCRLAFGSRISVGIMTFMKWTNAKKKCPDAHHFLLKGDRRTLWCRVITWVIKKVSRAKMRLGHAAADHFRVTTLILTRRSLTMMEHFWEGDTSNCKTVSYSVTRFALLRPTQVKINILCSCMALVIPGWGINRTSGKSMGVRCNQPDVLPEDTEFW